MALQMNAEQRACALENYNPASHLVKIKSKDGSLKDYLPASWRLYELSLRYADANFTTDLAWFDPERNLCIVKVRLYLGADFEMSSKKVEAMKSGPLTSLDKVETAAQARCARLFGVGTEFCLDMDDETPTDAPVAHAQPVQPRPVPAQPPRVAEALDAAAPSPQQVASLTKLATLLHKQVDQPANFAEAKALLASLSEEYNRARKAS